MGQLEKYSHMLDTKDDAEYGRIYRRWLKERFTGEWWTWDRDTRRVNYDRADRLDRYRCLHPARGESATLFTASDRSLHMPLSFEVLYDCLTKCYSSDDISLCPS